MEKFTNSTVIGVSKLLGSYLAIVLLLLLSFQGIFAQENPLLRQVTVDIDRRPISDALDQVASQGKFTYSYRSDLLPGDSLVTVQVRRMAVRGVTEKILGPGYDCKSVGNHVVIRKAAEAPSAEAPTLRRLEGFLIDTETGEKIRFATIYDNASRQNALSDPDGHYALELPGAQMQAELSISRRGYYDTVIVVNPSRVQRLTVGLRPYPYANQPLASREPDLDARLPEQPLPLADWLVSQNQFQLVTNLETPLHKFPIQVSLLPGLGTNRLMSGAIENNFSLNILAGYSNGVNGVEIGGLVNLVRGNVLGLQIGGLTNVVGGDVNGLQVAGLVNHVRGTVRGLQVGGILNYTEQPVLGMQAAGIANISRADAGKVQVSCIMNDAVGNVDGFQVAGFYNHAGGEVKGFQVSTLVNRADSNIQGFQFAGLANVSGGNVGNFQIAGIANVAADTVSGFQMSGIVNKARIVNGFQVGLINIADSVGGFCVGVLNLIKHGYKVVEFNRNESMQIQASYKAGRRQFYNILSMGYRFGPRHFALSYGAGFGTSQYLGRFTVTVEALVYDVIEQGLGPGRLNLLLPQRFSLGLPIRNRFELFGGLNHNIHITKPHNSIGEFKSELVDEPLWRHDGPETRVQGWLGYQVGVRVFL